MAKFFKDGFSKLHGVLNAPPRPPAADTELPAYSGKLSANRFALSQGVPLGLGAVVPKTLAHEPRAQLIGICTAEGHVHLFGQDLELCLKNPAAPVQPEFLFFPRPGLLLMFGVALAGSSTSGWVTQWWDLRSGGIQKRSSDLRAPGGIGTPQLLTLRFSIMCAAVSQDDAPLVFLGTDEGDVRVFDAGESPHMGAYCIPWDRLLGDAQQSVKDVTRPCPVMALAAAPPCAGAELLVGGAEGNVMLWSFERSRVTKTFQAPGTVSSLVWHASGTAFLASSRADIVLFNKNSTAALARVPIPGGPASSVTLLRWSDVNGNVAADSTPTDENPIHGEVLLRRGAPGPAVLNLWGPKWAQVDDLLPEADNPVTGAVLCQPARKNCGTQSQTEGGSCDPESVEENTQDASFGTMAVPCGCMAPPLSVIMQGAVKRSIIMERLAAAPVLLAALGDPSTRLVVSTVPPMRKLAWPATWGSLELVGTTALCLVPKEVKPLQWPCATKQEADERKTESVQTFIVEGGCMCSGAKSLPEGVTLGNTEGQLVLHAAENNFEAGQDVCESDEGQLVLHAAAENDLEAGQGVCWSETGGPCVTTCKVTTLEGTCAALTLANGSDEIVLLIDMSARQVSVRGPHAEESEKIDVEAGKHTVSVHQVNEKITLHWGDSPIWGPVPAEAPFTNFCWRTRTGQLHIASITIEELGVPPSPPDDGQTVKTLAAASEALFARRFANFSGFLAGGYELDPEPWQFVEQWSSMVGGWQGLVCSGHRDGKVRIWLRGHSTVLLLHTLSVRPQVPLPWRPQLAPCGDAKDPPQFRGVQRVRWYDGVDACPAITLSQEDAVDDESSWAWQITATIFEPATGALVAGTSSGALFLFRWRDSPTPLSLSEHGEWRANAPLHAVGGEEGSTDDGGLRQDASMLLLPAGFACVLRFRQHGAAVTRVQLTSTIGGRVHLAALDTASVLCIADADSGCVLFKGMLTDCPQAHAVDAGPPPPPATIEAFVLADRMMRAQAVAVDPSKCGSPKQEFIEPEVTIDTYILAASNGDLRQLTASLMGAQLLDGRIRETRLPGLPAGSALLMELAQTFLLVVQPGAAHVFTRPTDSELALSHSVPFASPALSAGLLELDGEVCLCIFLVTLAVHILTLPSLRTLKRLSAGEQASPFLAPRGAGPEAFFSLDGYFILCKSSPEGIRLWLASICADSCALDEAARMLPAASIAQATGQCKELASQPTGSSRTGVAGFGASLLSGLFGGGGGQRSLRECVAVPGHSGLPSEVDAATVDRRRGLAPAWRDPNERPPPPPPPPPGGPKDAKVGSPQRSASAAQSSTSSAGSPKRSASSARSSASSAGNPAAAVRNLQGMQGDLAQANARAVERGETVGQLANKSQKLSDDSANFLKMAQQLNAKQNSWF